MSKKFFLSFLIGFGAGFGTMLYLATAYHAAKHPNVHAIHPEFLLLLAPITLGLVNMFNVYTEMKYSFLLGILVALGFSSHGINIGLPGSIFNTTPDKARIIAMIYYTLLFIAIRWTNHRLI